MVNNIQLPLITIITIHCNNPYILTSFSPHMNHPPIEAEFWISPKYQQKIPVTVSGWATNIANPPREEDAQDNAFLKTLEDHTFPATPGRTIFDGAVSCQIRNEMVGRTPEETPGERVITIHYQRAVRTETMPSGSEIPEALREILIDAGYEAASPNNHPALQNIGLLQKL
jgi:hypothetical protein